MSVTHVVKQGECLSSIARAYGFADWRPVYGHASNAGLRRARPNPNLLYPGDLISIPDKDSKKEACATGQKHMFEVALSATKLRLRLLDEEWEPLAGWSYEIRCNRRVLKGSTSSEGVLETEVPADADLAELTLTQPDATAPLVYRWTLHVGHLDPPDQLTGAQARLNNLGFFCGNVDGRDGDQTRAAVAAFRLRHGMSAEASEDAVRAKLAAIHGC